MTPTPFDLNFRHLRAVTVIAAKGSISAAAEVVCLSQPAITQGVAKLELQLQVRLFERQANGMLPTLQGTMLAQRTDAAIGHITKAIRFTNGGSSGPMLLITATQLRAFLALANAGGFARAAQAEGVSQPALHRAVRELEQLCAYPLVERRGRGVMLTPRGNRLARGVRLASGEIAAAIAEILGEKSAANSIVVGAMPLSRALILPRAMAQFTAESPNVGIDVVEGSWRELVEPLLDGVLDLTIGALRNVPPLGLQQAPLMNDQLVVIGRAAHPLAQTATPSVGSLACFPWIVGQIGTPLHTQWCELFAGRELPASPITCGSVMVIREVLSTTDFLTLLSPAQVTLEIAAGVLSAIGPPISASTRSIGITTRVGWQPTRAQARFLQLIRNASSSTAPENQ